MTKRKPIDFIPASKAREEIGSHVFNVLPLYTQPEYLNATSTGKGWFARLEIEGQSTAYFPFTGEKWLWRWRIYQTPFSQRFTPFCEEGIVNKLHWSAWTNWLTTQTWTCSWSHSMPGFEIETKLKRNQFFSLNQKPAAILAGWKSNRRSALNKCKELTLKEVTHNVFFEAYSELRKGFEKNQWQPDEKERKILRQISQLDIRGLTIHRFDVSDESGYVSLIVLAFWAGRYHYLFSLSSQAGFKKEAVTFFFKSFIENHCPENAIFDFEGSNLPGISAFFRSFGAEEESYGLLQL